MRKLVKLALLGALLVSCQSPGYYPMPMQVAPQAPGGPGILRAASSEFAPQPNQELSLSVLRNLFKTTFADDRDNGRPQENIQMPRGGGFIYESLGKIKLFRQALYLHMDRVIKHEFNLPGKADALPRLTPQALQELQSVLKPGDIVLCGNNGSFVHALIYLGNDQIIHALAQLTGKGDFVGVLKETLTEYVSRIERDKFVVLRNPRLTPDDFQRMAAYAHSMVGTSYDSLFMLNTSDRVYCTELVYHALRSAINAPRIFPHKEKYGWELVTIEDFMDSPDLETIWTYNTTRLPPGQRHNYS